MKVIKRDGRAVDYDRQKIAIAIGKANEKIPVTGRASKEEIKEIIEYVESLGKKRMLVEDIQDIIEQKLMEMNKFYLAKEYITYRYRRALVRKQNTTDESILGIIRNGVQENNNSSRNTSLAASQRDFIAGEVSRDLTKRLLLPEKITKAYEQGILNFHNEDYFIQPIINSCFTRLEDMLENGTEINGIKIETPKDFRKACEVTAQIILAVSSNQYGEQTVDIMHLAKYINKSYKILQDSLKNIKKELSDESIKDIAKELLETEIRSSIENLIYQLNTIMTSNGKLPLITLILHLDLDDEYLEENEIIIKETLNQIYENGDKFSNNISFKILYVLNNLNNLNGEKYDYLTKQALRCSDKNLNISYITANKLNKLYKEGMFNQGVVSINLPQIAITSDSNKDNFWNELEIRLELCREALMYKHYALLGTLSNVSPIHWQHGAISRIEKNEKIDNILKSESARLSLTYVGLYETTKLMEGVSHTTKEGQEFSLKLIKKIKDTIKKWSKETGLHFTLYEETTENSTSYEFAKIDKEKFGTIQDITDKEYYINSYHISDTEKIDELEKIKFYSNFKELLTDGIVSYKIIPKLANNFDKIGNVINFI